MGFTESDALTAALRWHLDEGAGEAMADTPQDSTAKIAAPPLSSPSPLRGEGRGEGATSPHGSVQNAPSPNPLPTGERALLGSSEIAAETRRLALAASTREELAASIQAFDGIAIKKTATQMVFCDGNPSAPVMLVGEAPGADEDRIGRPFVGVSGQLLDRIFAWIGIDRTDEDPAKSIYIANILNWRPPGNRTPNAAEIEASLPFIERHIALVRPKLLIFSGGVSAQALLNRTEGISRLRGQWHNYVPRTPGIAGDAPAPIPALATYHPAYLLRTPSQKRAVWQDMLTLQDRLGRSPDCTTPQSGTKTTSTP